MGLDLGSFVDRDFIPFSGGNVTEGEDDGSVSGTLGRLLPSQNFSQVKGVRDVS